MKKKAGLILAVLVLFAILAIPTPPELSTAGHRMLGILVFSVIIEISKCMAESQL